MYIINSTKWNTPLVFEIIFVGVHNDSSWENPLDSLSSAKIALKLLSDSLSSILLDLFDHQGKKLVPLAFASFIVSGHRQILLSLVGHESWPKLLRIVVDVFWEVEHDSEPDVIGSYFYITVLIVGM